MLAEEPVLNQGARRVDFVDDWVGVPVVSSGEDRDLIVHICRPQTL